MFSNGERIQMIHLTFSIISDNFSQMIEAACVYLHIILRECDSIGIKGVKGTHVGVLDFMGEHE